MLTLCSESLMPHDVDHRSAGSCGQPTSTSRKRRAQQITVPGYYRLREEIIKVSSRSRLVHAPPLPNSSDRPLTRSRACDVAFAARARLEQVINGCSLHG